VPEGYEGIQIASAAPNWNNYIIYCQLNNQGYVCIPFLDSYIDSSDEVHFPGVILLDDVDNPLVWRRETIKANSFRPPDWITVSVAWDSSTDILYVLWCHRSAVGDPSTYSVKYSATKGLGFTAPVTLFSGAVDDEIETTISDVLTPGILSFALVNFGAGTYIYPYYHQIEVNPNPPSCPEAGAAANVMTDGFMGLGLSV
jgi:hypothetical protein